MKIITKFVGLALLLVAPHTMWAGNFINTASGGNWDSASSWTEGSGYPGNGDTIGLSGAGTITVINAQEFGATSGSSASSWGTSDNMVLGLTNGAVLTHNAGDTFTATPPNDLYLRGGFGGERFLNLGTFVNNSGYRRVHLINGLTFEERGTNKFASGNHASIAIDGTSTLLVNNGTINATANGYIGAKAAGATFTTFDGASLQGVNMVISPSTEFGLGYYYSSSANTLTGQVKIASISIGAGGTLSFGNVNMTVSTPASLAVSGKLNIGSIAGIGVASTVALGNDATWNFGGGGLNLYQGSTFNLQGHSLTNAGGGSLKGGSNIILNGGGGGRFVSQGTFANALGWRHSILTNSITFENQGTFAISGGGAGVSIDPTSTFFNNGGTIICSGGLAGNGLGAAADGGRFSNYDTNAATFQSFAMIVSNNTTFALGANANSSYTPTPGRLDGRVKFTSLDVQTGSALELGPYNNLTFQGALTSAGAMKVANTATFALDDNLTMNFGQGLAANGGTIDTRGNQLTIQGTSNVVCSSGGSTTTILASNTTGYVCNQGTLYIGPAEGASWRGMTLTNITGGVAFVNQGTVVLRNGDAVNNLVQVGIGIASGTTFSNAPGGLLVGRSLASPYTAGVFGANASSSVFDNQGTVQVLTNTLHFNVKIPQLSGTSLNGGTWKATGPNSVLTLPGSNLTTINTNAAVYLENGGSINRIGTALVTNNGGFFVNGTGFTTGGSGLTVGSSGTLGGSGTITGNVVVAGTLAPGIPGASGVFTISGSLTLTNGCKYVWDRDVTTQDWVNVTGTLALPTQATVILTNLVAGALPAQMTLFQAGSVTGAASLGSWTTVPDDYRVTINGTTVLAVKQVRGTVIILK